MALQEALEGAQMEREQLIMRLAEAKDVGRVARLMADVASCAQGGHL